ncbi:hypothetical protein D3C75_1044300 [compost metagenome]
MGDHQQRAAPLLQILLQPGHGVRIDMVRRLIQNQQLGRCNQRCRQSHTLALSTGQ